MRNAASSAAVSAKSERGARAIMRAISSASNIRTPAGSAPMPSPPPTAIAAAPLSSSKKRTSCSVSCADVGSGTKPPAMAPKNSSA